MNNKFYHSVYLEENLCVGCIHCLKRCPTKAIRVPNGKARIISEFCIDCGECIRHCPHHAKQTRHEHLDDLKKYDYKVALVDPSMYGQFNHLHDVNIMLTALIRMGFDNVFEVAYAYEYLAVKTREYLQNENPPLPIINTTCPSIERLIRVRFPDLIPHMLPFLPPVEIAAQAALKEAMASTGLPENRIGIIYIAPCPAQVSFARSPLGMEKTHINATIAMKDIYKQMIHYMNECCNNPMDLMRCGKTGVSVGTTCQEAKSICDTNYLAADGIENVINVLNDIEDGKIPETLVYAELKGCSAGCVGGPLNLENPYIARAKIKQLDQYVKDSVPSEDFFEKQCGIDIHWTQPVNYESVYPLGSNIMESMQRMQKVEDILRTLPKLDCGSCGAPTCRTLAEDIVRGIPDMNREKCIYLLRGMYQRMKREDARLRKEDARLKGEQKTDPSENKEEHSNDHTGS